eukprot:jgi/Chrpa1/8348/Chrysochromulina_OHIO_Genome00001913-RA
MTKPIPVTPPSAAIGRMRSAGRVVSTTSARATVSDCLSSPIGRRESSSIAREPLGPAMPSGSESARQLYPSMPPNAES